LLIHHYCQIPKETFFVTGTKQRKQTISVKALFDSLGKEKASALLGMHAITGSDTTGKLAGRTKEFSFKVFLKASGAVLKSLSMLGEDNFDVDEAFPGIEEYICSLYRSPYNTISKTRWYLFSNKQAQGSALPPTKDALLQHVQRANYQALVWKNATKPFSQIGCPSEHGWELVNELFLQIMTKNSAAPCAILELTKCNCRKGCLNNLCSCRQHELICTELCGCFLYECANSNDHDHELEI
jgi:hypothetical protein